MMCCPSFCLTFVLFHCLVGGCACVLSCCMSRFFSDLATIPDLAMLKLTIIADQATMGPTYVFEIDMGLVYTGRINKYFLHWGYF